MKRPHFARVLGIMSGTSLDGVDLVRVRFIAESAGEGASGLEARPEFDGWEHRPFPEPLRNRLRSCALGELTSWETAQAHHDLGRFYARIAERSPLRARVEAVGLHGQTVFHAPGGKAPATLQLGEPAYLAEALRVPVVSNFRAADLAVGGQGAPLATLFHLRVFARPGEHVCVNNLGGISNVTSLDGRRRGSPPRVLAFDTGPANLLLDEATGRGTDGRLAMDQNGTLARQGRVDDGLLRRWLRHPFLRRPPPKSTGRETFGGEYFEARWAELDAACLPLPDRLATLTEFTAQSIALNYRLHLPPRIDRVVWCGGGAKNAFLVARIEHAARATSPGLESVRVRDLGWPEEAVEGGAFALLARERLLDRPGNLPTTTGARRAVLGGQITDLR